MRTLLITALAAMSSLCTMANPELGDTIWYVPTDHFKATVPYSLVDADSVTFTIGSMKIHRNNGVNVPVLYQFDGDYRFQEGLLRYVYKPNEVSSMDFNNTGSRWCWQRSKESEHFICFWESGFGLNPKTADISLDVDRVLQRAEMLFDFYADSLGFVIPGASRSTDNYKIMIMVNHSKEWLATGSGYDDTIGALWCTPWALDASGGHTLGHEIGHSFQYLVSCDLGTNHGWRWGYEDNGDGGCAWWESCAQWQGFKVYPDQQFSNSYTNESIRSSHHNLLHEDWRYANYFIQDYWCMLHGKKFIGKLWRASSRPEDPVETYKRITEVDQAAFNNEIFDFARRSATYDIDGIRERGTAYQDLYTTSLSSIGKNNEENTIWQVDEASCPQNYGFNIIRLNNAPAGSTIKASFKGIAGADGYRKVRTARAGWRYGFAAQLNDGSRVYGLTYSTPEGEASFEVPENTKKLWFVVSGAPTEHFRHPWNDNDTDDEQWPYQVAFSGTDKYGEWADYPADYAGRDTTVVINAEIAYDGSNYSNIWVPYDMEAASQALGLSTSQLLATKIGNSSTSPAFVGIDSNGTSLTYNATTSTSSSTIFGHWFNENGNVCGYDGNARIYAEFQPADFRCKVGQYPGRLVKGRTYVFRQGLRAQSPAGQWHLCTYEIHLKVK